MTANKPLDMVSQNFRNHLKELESDTAFQYRVHGIQEEDVILRETNKQLIARDMLEICRPLIGMHYIDPDEFLDLIFRYLADWCYQRNMLVPFTHDELVYLGDNFLRTCIMSNKLSASDIKIFAILRKSYHKSHAVEKACLEGLTSKTSIDYQSAIQPILAEIEEEEAVTNSFFRNLKMSLVSGDITMPITMHVKEGRFHLFFEGKRYVFRYQKHGRGYRFEYFDQHSGTSSPVKPVLFFYQLLENAEKETDALLPLKYVFEQHGVQAHFQAEVGLDGIEITIKYQNASLFLRYDTSKNAFYRRTGEELLEYSALIPELADMDNYMRKEKSKAYQRASDLFESMMTEEEKASYEKTKVLFIEGEEHDYLIAPEIPYNSVLELPKGCKNVEEGKALCIVSKDSKVPRLDVLTTVKLMIQSGQEKKLNSLANRFFPNVMHRTVWNRLHPQ